MRLVFSFILLSAFFIRPVLELTPFVYYELNVDYIIDTYCINKSKPQLHCNGKCYLMSQLKTKNTSSEPFDNTHRIINTFIPLYFQDTQISVPLETSFNQKKKLGIPYEFQYTYLFINDFFEPPQLS